MYTEHLVLALPTSTVAEIYRDTTDPQVITDILEERGSEFRQRFSGPNLGKREGNRRTLVERQGAARFAAEHLRIESQLDKAKSFIDGRGNIRTEIDVGSVREISRQVRDLAEQLQVPAETSILQLQENSVDDARLLRRWKMHKLISGKLAIATHVELQRKAPGDHQEMRNKTMQLLDEYMLDRELFLFTS